MVAQRAPETLTLVQPDAAAHDRLEAEPEWHLAAARHQEDRLGELMRADPAAGQATWPLRRELTSHLDRFKYELGESKPGRMSGRRPPLLAAAAPGPAPAAAALAARIECPCP